MQCVSDLESQAEQPRSLTWSVKSSHNGNFLSNPNNYGRGQTACISRRNSTGHEWRDWLNILSASLGRIINVFSLDAVFLLSQIEMDAYLLLETILLLLTNPCWRSRGGTSTSTEHQDGLERSLYFIWNRFFRWEKLARPTTRLFRQVDKFWDTQKIDSRPPKSLKDILLETPLPFSPYSTAPTPTQMRRHPSYSYQEAHKTYQRLV